MPEFDELSGSFLEPISGSWLFFFLKIKGRWIEGESLPSLLRLCIIEYSKLTIPELTEEAAGRFSWGCVRLVRHTFAIPVRPSRQPQQFSEQARRLHKNRLPTMSEPCSAELLLEQAEREKNAKVTREARGNMTTIDASRLPRQTPHSQ